LPNSTWVFAKRSVSLTKVYSALGIFFAAFGIFVLDAIVILAGNSRYVLIPVGFMGFGILFFATSVIYLYIYDKNNGVLEYLLSLGWNQGDVFKRYLKASLFLALILFVTEFAVNVIVTVIAATPATTLLGIEMLALTAALSFSAVSLVTVSMVAFSSLQRQRVGSNSPLGLVIGVVVLLPSYYIPEILPFSISVLADLLIAGLAGALSVILLILSSRLIRREKMLP
jgi:magnesium-transporting ATPase (P-type)